MMDAGSFPALLPLLLHLLLLLLLLLCTPCLCNQHVSESRRVEKEPTSTHLPTSTPLNTRHHLPGFPGHSTKTEATGQHRNPATTTTTTTTTPIEHPLPSHSTTTTTTTTDKLKGRQGGESSTAGAPCTESPRTPATTALPLTPATAMVLLVAIVLFVGLLHFKVGAEVGRCWKGVTSECCSATAVFFSSRVVHKLKLALLLLVPASALGKRKHGAADVVQSSASGQALVPVVTVTVTGDGESAGLSSVVYVVDQERV